VERLGEVYRQSYGVEFASLRIGRVVGAGAQSTSSAWRSQIFEMMETEEAKKIALPYLGSERILLVHVEEVAKMLVALLRAPGPSHGIYNAVCESIIVADLRREIERLNSNIMVNLGDARAMGNPQRLDSGRFQMEFGFQAMPLFERLRSAGKQK
jgi:nucleoside-diphosphate-sugar epimerase